MAAAATDDGRSWYQPRRTQAFPKHSLMGASLEIRDSYDLIELQKIDIEAYERQQRLERLARQNRYVPKLPAYLKPKSSDVPADEKKELLTKRIAESQSARKTIDTLEHGARYFTLHVSDPSAAFSAPPTHRSSLWYTEDDIKNSQVLNKVGLKGRRTVNFNRDKYQTKPQKHQYSYLGDPLATGNDFTRHKMASRQKYDEKDIATQPLLRPSKNADDELVDPDDHANLERRMLRSRNANHLHIPDPDLSTMEIGGGYYASLSHLVRTNVFPYPSTRLTSEVRDNFTKDVFDRRSEPILKYRRHKDAYCVWRESHIIRTNMQKQWQDTGSKTVRVSRPRHHTHDQPVTTPPSKKPATTTKSNKKPRAKGKATKPTATQLPHDDLGLPEVVFETPPPTPPPPQYPTGKPVQRDDEFWNMYNKGV